MYVTTSTAGKNDRESSWLRGFCLEAILRAVSGPPALYFACQCDSGSRISQGMTGSRANAKGNVSYSARLALILAGVTEMSAARHPDK